MLGFVALDLLQWHHNLHTNMSAPTAGSTRPSCLKGSLLGISTISAGCVPPSLLSVVSLWVWSGLGWLSSWAGILSCVLVRKAPVFVGNVGGALLAGM